MRSRERGFTLIELMIVVAIISLLAAIAIPNFLKFQCKSKQTEAKAGLGALFNAEKAFLGEHNTYGTDLVNVGWEPEGSPIYLFGFGTTVVYPDEVGGIPSWDEAQNNTLNGVVVAQGDYSTGKMRRLSDGSPLAPSDLDPPAGPLTMCSGQQFIIGAVGDINPSGDLTRMDNWSIDEKRRMLNFPNDCQD